MGRTQASTYCRICEPLCGLEVTVEDGAVRRIRADREHPLSKGFACPKGIAMAEIQNDPDRVVRPLRRRADGEFEEVGWDEALDDIASRLRRIREEHGGDAIGWYFGNPATFSYSHPVWLSAFMAALKSPHLYSAGSQDVNNRFAASALLYGSPALVPIPDLKRTDLLLMLGANPLVSHGSVITAPRIKEDLTAIVRRGGRVVVADPRRTETARAYEHLPVAPDGDAWLLLSLLNVIFEEGLEDAEACAAQARGAGTLRKVAKDFPPESTQGRSGVPARTVRDLARDLVSAERAVVYGRTGTCLGRYGTLTAFLIDAVTLVTGNLDRPGGGIFGAAPMRLDELLRVSGLATYGKTRSRVGGYPDVLGTFPAGVMAEEITTPGPGRMRALVVSAGNPVRTVPGSAALEAALDELDLLVCIDLYVTDTGRKADYVLPATTFLEREDFPLPFLQNHLTPYVTWTDAVVPPRGEARQEWQIIDDLARRMGLALGAVALQRLAYRMGIRPSPRFLVDLLLRTGPKGDWYGLRRGGLSIRKLRTHPHGIVLGEHHRTGTLRRRILHKDKRVRLDPPEIVAEIERLAAEPAEAEERDEAYPLRLIGMRELRSHNSWMHNVPGLMRGKRRHAARVNPKDAAEYGLEDGALCRITSEHGAVELPVVVTDEMTPGAVAVPHGWGHQGGGWRVANAAGGANVNLLASPRPGDLEPLAGMAHLNGVPVAIAPATGPER
ncbi:putative molybdopterin oxidoreductase [Actinomadura sp. NBRC 104412]|uniref:molybdopterin-dependent oxidoreductase n=1 Tax=Actinomadura sp. NBRC 104412 TaxID=3032203 RepID=UPI0024A45733|nr:molybdopterin-dependent oxidoreductase [Actinomadura sp. NBRC 104412]GLZ05022.1 putative molybdopterin oxidoreductase [Actinomadura sp. NBRC 104412]